MKLRELIERDIQFISNLIKPGAVVFGGLCLLVYCNEIGQFPEGIGLGEGVAFFLICSTFALIYALYLGLSIAAGCTLHALPGRIALRWWNKKERADAILPNHVNGQSRFALLWNPTIISIGLFALCLLVGIGVKSTLCMALAFLLIAFLHGLGVLLLLALSARSTVGKLHEPGVGSVEQSNYEQRVVITRVRQVLLIALVTLPFGNTPALIAFVNKAFSLAQLRKENATVHIQSPWYEPVQQGYGPATGSFLGADYRQFQHMTVLLQGVGSKVVIQLREPAGTRSFAIPKESIQVP